MEERERERTYSQELVKITFHESMKITWGSKVQLRESINYPL
jgi:hypothetical protein